MFMLFLIPALLGLAFAVGLDETPEEPEAEIDPEFPTGTNSYVGTPLDDTIRVLDNELDYIISGGDGDDVIETQDGNDSVRGDAGNDIIRTHAGDDAVLGGEGHDTVDLGSGNDTYFGQESFGDDTILGGDGDDLIMDSLGSNTLDGGTGADRLNAINTDETISSIDFDTLSGGEGDDDIFADDGDIVTGGLGADTVGIWVDQADDDAVTLTDFNPDEDMLMILLDSAGKLPFSPDDDPQLEYDLSEDQTGIIVSLNGQEIAHLEGITSIDPEQVALIWQ